MNFHISKVTKAQKQEINQYVQAFRIDLFPMLDPIKVPNDLLNFESTYITHPDGCFLQARDDNGSILGVIGMIPYDHRFPYLNYEGKRTVEVARLFVEQAYRKKGLATALFIALQEEAKKRGIEMLYLHTHPFLTGAFECWERQGFELVATTVEGGFETLHMEKLIEIELKNT